jgi:hypothetical protein
MPNALDNSGFIGMTITASFMLFFIMTMYLVANDQCEKHGREKILESLTSTRLAIFGIGYITTLFFNMVLSSYLFRNASLLTVSNSTFAYFFGLVAPLFAFLNWFPNMVGIFENTIGIAIVKWISSLNYDSIVKIFKLKTKGIPEIPMDFIIPTLSVFNYDKIIEEMKQKTGHYTINLNGYCSPSGETLENSNYKTFLRDVFNLCLAKHTIGHMIWYLISVSLVVLLTYEDQRNVLTVE